MRRVDVNFESVLAKAIEVRRDLIESGDTTAYRLVDGAGDGVPGIYVDRYGPAAVLNVHDDAGWSDDDVTAGAYAIVGSLSTRSLEAVYAKPFSRDRTRLGGKLPAETTSSQPRAGRPQRESLIVQEHGSRFEVRLYDGFSTGLFLEHREHRRALAERGIKRALNLFAYTCAFSVPLASAGAHVTNVDVSVRYLDWGRRNHALNDIDTARVKYSRMDALAYLNWAARREAERFDLVILDPPTFGAGDPRRGIKPWKAIVDYPALLLSASKVLAPGGLIFVATNTRELAAEKALKRMVEGALGRVVWEALPPWPGDVREQGRVAAGLFRLVRNRS